MTQNVQRNHAVLPDLVRGGLRKQGIDHGRGHEPLFAACCRDGRREARRRHVTELVAVEQQVPQIDPVIGALRVQRAVGRRGADELAQGAFRTVAEFGRQPRRLTAR